MARVPSTQALRALESFDRHGTVWQAADELSLTRSAVSHQLRLLERELGFPLLNRVGTRVELTEKGRKYADDVRRALSMIASSASQNAAEGVSGTLTISSPAGFASSWLCPKVTGFLAQHPDVSLSIVTPRRLDDTGNPNADLFVIFGHDEGRADMTLELLQQVSFTPLCSPAYLNRFDGFPTPKSLLGATLLHLAEEDDWQQWFRRAGLPQSHAHSGIKFSDMNLVYAATYASQGISMGDEFICGDAMEKGQLVSPFDLTVQSTKAYYLAIPREKESHPAVAAFHAWLRTEMLVD